MDRLLRSSISQCTLIGHWDSCIHISLRTRTLIQRSTLSSQPPYSRLCGEMDSRWLTDEICEMKSIHKRPHEIIFIDWILYRTKRIIRKKMCNPFLSITGLSHYNKNQPLSFPGLGWLVTRTFSEKLVYCAFLPYVFLMNHWFWSQSKWKKVLDGLNCWESVSQQWHILFVVLRSSFQISLTFFISVFIFLRMLCTSRYEWEQGEF